jgi:hypothetical protein
MTVKFFSSVLVELHYGDIVYGDFPLEEDKEKSLKRWVFVLVDHGEKVTVAYITTSPAYPGSVRIGQLENGRIGYLLPWKIETVFKARLQQGRWQRVPLPSPGIGSELLGDFIQIANLSLEDLSNPLSLPLSVCNDLISNYEVRMASARSCFQKLYQRKGV